MTTSANEQETTIVFERTESQARIYSCDETFKTKMRRRGFKPCRIEADGFFWEVPKNLVSVRQPRILSDADRAKRSETMRSMRSEQIRHLAQQKENNLVGVSSPKTELPLNSNLDTTKQRS